MNTFDRYLLREWLQIFGLVVAITCGLLFVHVLYDDFRDLRDFGASGWVLWEYLLVTIPSFFAHMLPLALLVSLLYVLGKLHRSNELTVLRAAGVGFGRMMVPVWIVGFLCCGLTWWLNTTIVPRSLERSETMREELQFRTEATRGISSDRVGAVFSVAFDNRQEGRMWFFNRYSRYRDRGYGVSVSELDAQRREQRRIVASEAWLEAGRGWVFRNGRELAFSPETGELRASRPFEERVEGDFHENPELMLLIDRKPSDLSLHQLRRLIAHLEEEQSPKVTRYAVRYFSLIADTLGPLLVIAIAIPFAVSGVRVNPAVGVSKSIGLFFLYYIFMNFGTSLATKQIVEPIVAAWLPYVGMLGLAARLFTRLR